MGNSSVCQGKSADATVRSLAHSAFLAICLRILNCYKDGGGKCPGILCAMCEDIDCDGGKWQMQLIDVETVAELLRQLPPDKLAVVYELVANLANDEQVWFEGDNSTALQMMFASEAILRRDWDSPEEDVAWAHL